MPPFAIGDRRFPPAGKEGHQIFVDELTHFAARCRNPRLTPIIRHVTGPLHVAVRGRDGVGRGTVAAALAGAGVTVTADVDAADVDVMVIAEVLKPEERAVLAGTAKPTLTVLNKADLTGYGAGGPMALAQRRAAQYRALTGVPTVPMVGLLAIAVLDDELVYALRLLTTEPADMTLGRRVPADGAPPVRVTSGPGCSTPWIGSASPTPYWHCAEARTPRRCRRCCVGSARSTGSSRS